MSISPWSAVLAQRTTASLEVGTVNVRFADASAFSALTVSPSILVRRAQLTAALSASASQIGVMEWAKQGTAILTAFTGPSARGFLGEAGVTMGGSSYPDGARTAQGIVSVRAHWLGQATDRLRLAHFGAWMGGGLGSMHDGTEWRGVKQLEFGANLQRGAQSLMLMATPSITSDTLRYADLLAALSTSAGVLDVVASLGGRLGATLPIAGGDQRIWGGVNISAWVAPRGALTLGVGTYPVDVTQGFPAGRYLSAGFRLGAERARRPTENDRSRRVIRAARESGVDGLTLQSIGSDIYAIRVRAPRAALVEVSGEATSWRPITLVRDGDGWWRGRLVLIGASTELVVRVDGGGWIVPPGAEEIVDEFGGRTGRLVVPRS